MADAISTPESLLTALGLDPATLGVSREAAMRFRLLVPRSFVRRMRPGDPHDPLLRQVLPLDAEDAGQPGFESDPVGDLAALRAPALLHKYRGRVLLVTTAACAIHCRYCFRREFPYAEAGNADGEPRWAAALETIASDASIEEVILSGGDPLALSDRRLQSLTDSLRAIPHVRRLRIHTRQPIVLPSRVDAGLMSWLEHLPWPVAIVLHANHPNEIDAEVADACARLRSCVTTLLNQTVLLRGVNDSADTLAQLSERLFESGVLPYYLHVLDRVRGAAHFDVPEATARRIAGELAARLPGYLVPRLVREVKGAPAKLGLAPHFAKDAVQL